jgi:hypothetical protein
MYDIIWGEGVRGIRNLKKEGVLGIQKGCEGVGGKENFEGHNLTVTAVSVGTTGGRQQKGFRDAANRPPP